MKLMVEQWIKRLFNIRIIRYGLVGGIGIPVQDGALFIFKLLFSGLFLTVNIVLFGHPFSADLHYALASACAFEVSTTINFVLNQFFTYREQKIRGWDWVRRAITAQITSSSALLLTFMIGLVLVYGFGVNEFIANPIGIIVVFIYNFFVSRKFVFRSTSATAASETVAPAVPAIPLEEEVPVSDEVKA